MLIVEVRGWQLTYLGHGTYCKSCEDVDLDTQEEEMRKEAR